MSAHVPGPWRVVEREVMEDGGVYPRHILGGPTDLQVCLLEGMSVAELAMQNPGSLLGTSRIGAATAALITAAPDLLVALVGMVDRFDEDDINAPIFKRARAAIAKATGETA